MGYQDAIVQNIIVDLSFHKTKSKRLSKNKLNSLYLMGRRYVNSMLIFRALFNVQKVFFISFLSLSFFCAVHNQ